VRRGTVRDTVRRCGVGGGTALVRAALLVLVLALAGSLPGERAVGGSLPRAYNGLAATPPMGWND
jgi:hypothetical protein